MYRISVALPVKGPNLISSKGGWKPRMCRASSWEIGGRLVMQIKKKKYTKYLKKLHSDPKTVQSLHTQLTCLHPECCTGSSSRTPERIFHMKSCTVVDLCSTWSRMYIHETTRPQPGLSRRHVAMRKPKQHYHLRRSSTFLCLISSSEMWGETSWRFLLGLSDDFIFLVLHFFTLPGTHHQAVLWLFLKAWGRQVIKSYYKQTYLKTVTSQRVKFQNCVFQHTFWSKKKKVKDGFFPFLWSSLTG